MRSWGALPRSQRPPSANWVAGGALIYCLVCRHCIERRREIRELLEIWGSTNWQPMLFCMGAFLGTWRSEGSHPGVICWFLAVCP